MVDLLVFEVLCTNVNVTSSNVNVYKGSLDVMNCFQFRSLKRSNSSSLEDIFYCFFNIDYEGRQEIFCFSLFARCMGDPADRNQKVNQPQVS